MAPAPPSKANYCLRRRDKLGSPSPRIDTSKVALLQAVQQRFWKGPRRADFSLQKVAGTCTGCDSLPWAIPDSILELFATQFHPQRGRGSPPPDSPSFEFQRDSLLLFETEGTSLQCGISGRCAHRGRRGLLAGCRASVNVAGRAAGPHPREAYVSFKTQGMA